MQENREAQKKEVTCPPFRKKKYNTSPSGQSYRLCCSPRYRLVIVTSQAWWQLWPEQKTFKNNFCIRNDSGDCQLSRNHSKKSFGKSFVMENAEAHHESLAFRKEQYGVFVEVRALQVWFYLKSRSLKTTRSTPRRHTHTSGSLKRYHGVQREINCESS